MSPTLISAIGRLGRRFELYIERDIRLGRAYSRISILVGEYRWLRVFSFSRRPRTFPFS
jgi:hypothetical protein